MLPLDLTISAGELSAKFREGRITIVPFTDVALSWEGLYGQVRDVVVFIPLGMLLSTWRTTDERAVRSLGTTLLLGAVAGAAIELAQLLVLSRYSSSTDCVMSALGAAMGGLIMLRWHRFRHRA